MKPTGDYSINPDLLYNVLAWFLQKEQVKESKAHSVHQAVIEASIIRDEFIQKQKQTQALTCSTGSTVSHYDMIYNNWSTILSTAAATNNNAAPKEPHLLKNQGHNTIGPVDYCMHRAWQAYASYVGFDWEVNVTQLQPCDLRIWVNRIKRDRQPQTGARGCTLCGTTRFLDLFPCAYDFDHLDPEYKFFKVSAMVAQRYRPFVIYSEIQKCRLLCVNCHVCITKKMQKNKNI